MVIMNVYIARWGHDVNGSRYTLHFADSYSGCFWSIDEIASPLDKDLEVRQVDTVAIHQSNNHNSFIDDKRIEAILRRLFKRCEDEDIKEMFTDKYDDITKGYKQ